MTNIGLDGKQKFDRTNAILAGFVFLGSFVVYAMTVQQSFSFWDCGEFIASAVILGIPHPPGTPMLILICRIFSMIPFVEDISHRINYLSVLSSALTAMFSYLVAVRLARFFIDDDASSLVNRLIVYVGGIAGGFFVAFSATNWANSVEAEAYGLALALSVSIVWLTLIYWENRHKPVTAFKLMALAIYLAVLGIGVHMTVFLVLPVCSIFFILNEKAERRDYLVICGFAVTELLLIILFGNGRGGAPVFKFVSVALGAAMFIMLYRKIRWGILIAIAATSTVMISFALYFWAMALAPLAIIGLGLLARRQGWQVQWKTALAVLVIGFLGFSVHFMVPIRSSLNPRIDENNASRDWRTFVNFLDRRQYGQVSMVDRMFERRGTWTHQFGRHPHMGFWSYFEKQYGGSGGWSFMPFFGLGLLGLIVAIRKRREIGVPFFTLILLASAGLILYMNFADGIKYNFATGDAYQEVRNRDYFFTPAFVFFGIAMGMGVSALMLYLKNRVAGSGPQVQRLVVFASSLLVFLPVISLGANYHACDRSNNFLPRVYATNLLDSCEPNSILFTAGDNDTFSVWCMQEAYNYRRDVKVVNLSLLNTDWYVEQMKYEFGVPISLTREQIRWHPFQMTNGAWTSRPAEPFHDRPRGRTTYMHPQFSGISTQNLMVDEIVIENKWRLPIYFNQPPYAGSPLKLRNYAVQEGQVYRLRPGADGVLCDVEKSYDHYMNVCQFDGLESSAIYRDESATGNFALLGLGTLRVYDLLVRQGDQERATALMERMIKVVPEFWQAYVNLADAALVRGDTAGAVSIYRLAEDTLTALVASNDDNQYYVVDLGATLVEIGKLTGDQALITEGVELTWKGFDMNRNSGMSYRKLISVLREGNRYSDLDRATRAFADYKVNRNDPLVQSLMGISTQGR